MLQPGMHASKQLAHRISQRLKDLRTNSTDTSRAFLAIPVIVSDTLAYREAISRRVSVAKLLSETELLEILQYTVRWLDLQDNDDNELIMLLPELIEFSLNQVEQRTSGNLEELDAVFFCFQLILTRRTHFPRRESVLAALIDTLNYLSSVWTRRKQLYLHVLEFYLPHICKIFDFIQADESAASLSVLKKLERFVEYSLFAEGLLEELASSFSSKATNLVAESEPGHKKFKTSYISSFYDTILKMTENLQLCDITSIRRVLYIYGRASHKLVSENSSSGGDGAIILWRKHCLRVLQVNFSVVSSLTENYSCSSVSGPHASVETQLKCIHRCAVRNAVLESLSKSNWFDRDFTDRKSEKHNQTSSLPNHPSISNCISKYSDLASIIISNIYSLSIAIIDKDNDAQESTEEFQRLVAEEVKSLTHLLDIDHRVLLEGSSEESECTFGLQAEFGRRLMVAILLASKSAAFSANVNILFSQILRIYGDLRRLEDLISALIEFSRENDDNDMLLSRILVSTPVTNTLLDILNSATSLQRSHCWTRLLRTQVSSSIKIIAVVLVRTENPADCSEERFKSLIDLLNMCAANAGTQILESQMLLIAVSQFASEAVFILPIKESSKVLIFSFLLSLREAFRSIKKSESMSITLAVLFCAGAARNFVRSIVFTLALCTEGKNELDTSLVDEVLECLYSDKLTRDCSSNSLYIIQCGLLDVLPSKTSLTEIIKLLDEIQLQKFFEEISKQLPNVLECKLGTELLPICLKQLNQQDTSEVADLTILSFLQQLLAAAKPTLQNSQISQLWLVLMAKRAHRSSSFLDKISSVLQSVIEICGTQRCRKRKINDSSGLKLPKYLVEILCNSKLLLNSHHSESLLTSCIESWLYFIRCWTEDPGLNFQFYVDFFITALLQLLSDDYIDQISELLFSKLSSLIARHCDLFNILGRSVLERFHMIYGCVSVKSNRTSIYRTADCLRVLTAAKTVPDTDIIATQSFNKCNCNSSIRLAVLYLFSAVTYSRLSINYKLPDKVKYHTLKVIIHQLVQVPLKSDDRSEEVICCTITSLAALASSDMGSALAELLVMEAKEVALFGREEFMSTASTFSLCASALLRFSLAYTSECIEVSATALAEIFEVIAGGVDCRSLKEVELSYILKQYVDALRAISFRRSKVITNALSSIVHTGLLSVSRMIDAASSPPAQFLPLVHLSQILELLFSKLSSEVAPRFIGIISLMLRRLLRLIFSTVANKGSCNRILIRVSSLPSIQKQFPFLVSSVVEILAEFPETKQERHQVLPGLFAIIDRITPKDRKRVHATLNQQARLLLAEIFEMFLSDYKFFGKV